MTARALAWRTVPAEPARAALAVTGVAVIGALLFDMLLLSRGLLVSFRELLDTPATTSALSRPTRFRCRIPIANATARRGRRRAAARSAGGRGRPPRSARSRSCRAGADRGRRCSTCRRAPSGRPGGWWPARICGACRRTAPAAPAVVSQTLAARARTCRRARRCRFAASRCGVPSAMPAVAFRVVGVAEFQFESGGDLRRWRRRSTAFQRVRASASDDDGRRRCSWRRGRRSSRAPRPRPFEAAAPGRARVFERADRRAHSTRTASRTSARSRSCSRPSRWASRSCWWRRC